MEKKVYMISEGGEWRLHKPDEFHPDAHYDYKPKNGSWKEVPIAVEN